MDLSRIIDLVKARFREDLETLTAFQPNNFLGSLVNSDSRLKNAGRHSSSCLDLLKQAQAEVTSDFADNHGLCPPQRRTRRSDPGDQNQIG